MTDLNVINLLTICIGNYSGYLYFYILLYPRRGRKIMLQKSIKTIMTMYPRYDQKIMQQKFIKIIRTIKFFIIKIIMLKIIKIIKFFMLIIIKKTNIALSNVFFSDRKVQYHVIWPKLIFIKLSTKNGYCWKNSDITFCNQKIYNNKTLPLKIYPSKSYLLETFYSKIYLFNFIPIKIQIVPYIDYCLKTIDINISILLKNYHRNIHTSNTTIHNTVNLYFLVIKECETKYITNKLNMPKLYVPLFRKIFIYHLPYSTISIILLLRYIYSDTKISITKYKYSYFKIINFSFLLIYFPNYQFLKHLCQKVRLQHFINFNYFWSCPKMRLEYYIYFKCPQKLAFFNLIRSYVKLPL